MKNEKNNPEKSAAAWADEVLESLDGCQRAQANPFLYTRVMARLEAQYSAWEKAANWLSRPGFAFSVVFVFIAVNVSVLFWNQKERNAAVAQKQAIEQALAAEFSNTQTYALVDVNEDKK